MNDMLLNQNMAVPFLVLSSLIRPFFAAELG
jgi:hypothetical protein